MTAREALAVSKIIPVITIENAEDAIPLAKALLEGGVPVMEITLRTEAGLASIAAVAKEVPDMVVGAGTVLTPEQFDAVCAAGSKFVISPGATPKLLAHAAKSDIPLIPGVATGSEIMQALEFGFDTFKLFPANIAGGIGALKAYGGPFGDVVFCPTGGVNLENINDFLALDNVMCAGGTWLTPKEAITNHNFDTIIANCKEVVAKIN